MFRSSEIGVTLYTQRRNALGNLHRRIRLWRQNNARPSAARFSAEIQFPEFVILDERLLISTHSCL